MLTIQLKDLEKEGIIKREAFATVPPTVEYSLTELGKTVQPLISYITKNSSFKIS
jgi:DNA-binding HxlR family transcriptional regulator